jgi:hypothetical protein
VLRRILAALAFSIEQACRRRAERRRRPRRLPPARDLGSS